MPANSPPAMSLFIVDFMPCRRESTLLRSRPISGKRLEPASSAPMAAKAMKKGAEGCVRDQSSGHRWRRRRKRQTRADSVKLTRTNVQGGEAGTESERGAIFARHEREHVFSADAAAVVIITCTMFVMKKCQFQLVSFTIQQQPRPSCSGWLQTKQAAERENKTSLLCRELSLGVESPSQQAQQPLVQRNLRRNGRKSWRLP